MLTEGERPATGGAREVMMAALTVTQLTTAGVTLTRPRARRVAVTFTNTGTEFLFITNGGGAGITVTFDVTGSLASQGEPGTDRHGFGEQWGHQIIGPFDPAAFGGSVSIYPAPSIRWWSRCKSLGESSMAQTTTFTGGSQLFIAVATDGSTWNSIEGNANKIEVAEQNRMNGVGLHADTDTGVITYGKLEPVEITVTCIYTRPAAGGEASVHVLRQRRVAAGPALRPLRATPRATSRATTQSAKVVNIKLAQP